MSLLSAWVPATGRSDDRGPESDSENTQVYRCEWPLRGDQTLLPNRAHRPACSRIYKLSCPRLGAALHRSRPRADTANCRRSATNRQVRHNDVVSEEPLPAALASLSGGLLVLLVHTAGEAVPVGTGFLINSEGRFVTAEHVAARLRDLVNTVHSEPIEVKAILPSLPHLGAIPIKKLWTRGEGVVESDITVGTLRMPSGSSALPAFTVAEAWPTLGEVVIAVGFASMLVPDAHTSAMFELGADQTFLVTSVSHLYADGYVLVYGPVFEMQAAMPPGMSGGPILRGSTGEVIGVCSYGGTGEDEVPYCFGSVLRPERLQLVQRD